MEYVRQQIAELNCVVAAEPGSNTDLAVIICHGFGAPGTDLVPIADELVRGNPELTNCRFIFPAAPNELDPHFDSRAWWHIDMEQLQRCMQLGEFREMRNSIPDGLEPCSEMISNVVGEIRTAYGLGSEQIVLGGFSQGAMLTTNIALNSKEALGGLIVWSGSLINETAWRKAAETAPKLSIAQSHGKLDPILPFFAAEELRDLFTQANHSVEFVEFHGQHAIPPKAIDVGKDLLLKIVGG